MRMRQMMSAFSTALSGARVCWMRDEDGHRVSVLAILGESSRLASDGARSRRLADKAETIACQEAERVGPVVSTGVFMGGNGNGSVTATGIAEMPWTPEIERKLSSSGITQLR